MITRKALSIAFILPLLAPIALTAQPAAKQAKITKAKAEQIALAREKGKIKSGELEKEHGRMIYSFDIQTKDAIHEVNVDANTGVIVEDSVESPADEAKEAAQERAKSPRT
ncbi:MAG: peptidase M4 [Acidobacteria bacterium]|nr:peptidase M4 [Acidobacteriota bacterium]MBW4046285.1 peptidase M4 [Acidobacteriota bacterium]